MNIQEEYVVAMKGLAVSVAAVVAAAFVVLSMVARESDRPCAPAAKRAAESLGGYWYWLDAGGYSVWEAAVKR